jgi:glycosyltransferase involved in cell wall biosynthesis
MTDPNPAVSVIIPSYNYARFLRASVGSVLDQTLGDLEVIVIDDGSTDETPEVGEQLAKEDSRVRYIRKENGGHSSARNAGIQAARGEFICFLDADDTYKPDRISRHVAVLRENPEVSIVFGDEETFDELTGHRFVRDKSELPLDVHRLVACKPVFAPFNPTMRASLVRQVGGFDQSLIDCEDWDFWIRVLRLGKAQYVAGITGTYRFHGAQLTKRWREVIRGREVIRKRYFRKLDSDGFLAWSYHQWYCLRAFKHHKTWPEFFVKGLVMFPQALVPGRLKFLDRLFFT